jgi:hypothetical protein
MNHQKNLRLKVFFTILLFFVIYSLFSQTELPDTSNFDLKEIREKYELSRNTLYNDIVPRLLMGDIELLDHKLSILALAQTNKPILRILRNMIYAKHGFIFQSQNLSTYFSTFNWYKPRFRNEDNSVTEVEKPYLDLIRKKLDRDNNPRLRSVDNLFTEVDKINTDLIRSFEAMDDSIADIAKEEDYIGYWHIMPYFADSPSIRFILKENGVIEYGTNSMAELRLLDSITGKYEIKGNVLEFQATQIEFYINNAEFESSFDGVQWKEKDFITATFDKPIIYRFPITLPVLEMVYDPIKKTNVQLEVIRIGNETFYRMKDVPRYY